MNRVWHLQEQSQTIRIEAGCLARLGPMLREGRTLTQALLVSDSRVAPLYAEAVLQSLKNAGIQAQTAVVPAGEGAKSLDQVGLLYNQLAAMHLRRDDALVALGGGVVTDLTGFVAATWMRGVEWVGCPTSLEGAIDAAVGGKTAVNHASGKNLVGAFHAASQVFIDPLCLRTLPRRELVAGLAESIKHALIDDESFLAWHEANRDAILACDPGAMEELIARNVAIKMGVAALDFREQSGARERLNFGHTLGHAIEAASGYELRHGECVSLGMVAAARIACVMGMLGTEERQRIERVLGDFGLPTGWKGLPDAEMLLGYLMRDKKVAGARPRWILLSRIGTTVVSEDVSFDIIRDAIAAMRLGRPLEQ